MRNILNKLILFMQGRNGVDQLSSSILILFCLLGFIRLFFRYNKVGFYIILSLMTLLLLIAFYRIFSKNIDKRHRENEIFLNYFFVLKKKIILLKDRVKDIKTKRYRTCPYCKNVLRIPYRKGKHTVLCPKCNHEFNVTII